MTDTINTNNTADSVATNATLSVTDYTYSLLYKLYEAKPNELSSIGTLNVLEANISFKTVNDFSKYYSAIADSININCEIKYKYLEIALKRNVFAEEGYSIEEEVVLHEIKDLYPHQYKFCFLITDYNPQDITTRLNPIKILLGVRTFYPIEYADFTHYIDSVEFDNKPTEIQHVSLVLTDANENVINQPNHDDGRLIETIGNVIFHIDNISVDSNGKFITSDTDETPKRFYLNKTYDENGELISDNNQYGSLEDDSKYNLYVYHHESGEVIIKNGYTPQKIYVGDNPIWGKICYRDSDLEIYTDVDILARGQLSADLVKWFFDLSNSTHGIGVSGGIQYPIPEEEVTDFHFLEVSSRENPEESYTAMDLNNGNYITLPNKYYKADYEDKGFASNCWTNDIFGNIDFSKLSYNEDGTVKVDTDGNYLDKWGSSLTENNYTFRTLFFKFYINSDDANETEFTLLKFINADKYVIIKITKSSKLYIYTQDRPEPYTFDVSISGTTINTKTWYNFLMVVQHGIIRKINISDINTYSNGPQITNKGIYTIPGTENYSESNTNSRRISVNRTSTIEITYKAIGIETDAVYFIPTATVYKYLENDELIGEPNTSFDNYRQLINTASSEDGSLETISVTFEHGGYAIIPGIKFISAKGGFTKDFSMTISYIKLDGVNITEQILDDIRNNNAGKDENIIGNFMLNTNVDHLTYPVSVWFKKTGDIILNPIGGSWLDVNINASNLNADWNLLNPSTFTTVTNNKIILGDNENTNNNIVLGKLGLHIAYLSEDIDIKNPYKFIPETIINNLGKGYTYSPKVKFTYSAENIIEFLKDSFKELKNNKVWVKLPANLPLGNCDVSVISSDEVLYNTKYIVKTVQPDDETIDFEIDFNTDFEKALDTFSDRFYIRQEKRAGDLSGGENGHLVYFDRGEKCIVFENHGDFYDGQICCNEKDSGENRWYGGVAPQIKFPTDSNGNIIWYSDKNIPNPLNPRTQRVGSLIQSKDYYGYGEIELDMKIPVDFKGEAICWWMFHYQELYWPMDKDRFSFYAGGLDDNVGLDEPCHKYTIGSKKGKWNYRHSFKTDSGLPYIIVNNEIDMELGSEINQINTSKNPNYETSITFYVPLLDPRTVIGCTTEGENYGLWLLDYEASLPAIQAKMDQINSITEEYIDRENGEYLGISAAELVWVHVSDNINDRICYDASTRAIRWNNWWTEPDVGGTLYKTRYSNVVKAANGETNYEDGTSGWDICNTVASTTPRTPLGVINLQAEKVNDRYIPHEMDDGKWHKYKFVWHRDYTECYIDGNLIRRNATCSPFIPMPFLIGGWFPSDNSWGDYANSGYYGTWAGVTAPWDVRHFYVRRIKYRHYTEEESPRDQMLYHGETYPYSGLREFNIIRKEVSVILNITAEGEVNQTPTYQILTNEHKITVDETNNNKLTSYKNVYVDIIFSCYKHKDYRTTIIFDKDKTIPIQLELDDNPTYYTATFNNLPENYNIVVENSNDAIIENNTVKSIKGDSADITINANGYKSNSYHVVFDENKEIDGSLLKYVNLTLQVNTTGFTANIEENNEFVINGNNVIVSCVTNDIIHYTISKDGYNSVSGTVTMYNVDRKIIITLSLSGGKNLKLRQVSSIGSVIIPINGYSENGIIGLVENPVGNIMTLTVKPNVNLGKVIIFAQDYPPYVWEMPVITDDYEDSTEIDLPITRENDKYTKMYTIKRKVSDNESIIPKLELDWGDGYYEIPSEYENIPRYQNTSWNYRCTAKDYITQEGIWDVTHEIVTKEIILSPSAEVTITARLTPSEAIMDVMNPDDNTHTQIANGESIVLIRNKTYYITITAENYMRFDENTSFSSSGDYSVTLEPIVK